MVSRNLEISRRQALTGAAGLVVALQLPLSLAEAGPAKAPIDPNAFVRIGPDSRVTVIVKHVELGQGPLTGLSTLVAEELDADWSQMTAEHAPANARVYGNPALGGTQATGGSTSMAVSYEAMRKAGATARALLVRAAAEAWGVPAGEIGIERGVISHQASSRSGSFGEFAEAAARLPVPKDAPLKDSSAFRLIGVEGAVQRLDVPAKTDGSARYAIDIREPGLLTAVVARPPRFGARLAGFDASRAIGIEGVVAVRAIPDGVAVYARHTWAALEGRRALKTRWDESRAETRGSEEIVEQFRALAKTPGIVAGAHGDAAAALQRADRVVEAEYVFPYLAHAPMEPLDGTIAWDGEGVVARYGAQAQTLDQGAIARVLGVTPDKVHIETMLAGGSFGRRGQFTAHFAQELAAVAKAIGPGRPVKLLWTREDDIRGGYYRPIFVHRLRGAVGDGLITAWSNTIVGQSFAKGTPFEGFVIDANGADRTMTEGARELLYQVPDFHCDLHIAETGVPVLWWRSVGHTHTGYAVECFVDELIEATGQDPIVGRLAMLDKRSRAAAVLIALAKRVGWTGPGPKGGRAHGVALVESFGSTVAQIAEVSLGDGGAPRVHKVWCAVDCGLAVNPDVVRAQIEGGVGFGLGHALHAEVALEEGRVVPSNFDGYRALRMHEMPDIDVLIVPSARPPSGIGEPGVPPIAPAVANAMARLGPGRPRRLPMLGASA